MKSKLAWIPFVPLFFAAGFFKLAQEMMPEGSVFGLSTLQMEYCYIGACVLIFLFTLLFVAVDKKISQYYLPHKNFPAGLIGILLAVLLAADGGLTFFQVFNSGTIPVVEMLGAVMALLSAVVFIILGLNHSIRYKEGKSFSLIHVLPAVFCGVRMILSFMQFTTISIKIADVSVLICYVFATLFFYNYAVVLSLIKSKNALKSCFVFGFPAVAIMIPYGVYHLWFHFDSITLLKNAQPLEMILFGLYILSILIEMTAFVKDRDYVTVIETEEPARDPANDKVDGFIANNISEDQNDSEENNEFLENSDTDGYLYRDTHGANDAPDETVQKVEQPNPEFDSYLTEVQEETPETDDRPKDYESRLDEIDKLILDISRKSE